MQVSQELNHAFEEISETYPFPLAVACRRFLDNPPKDNWQEWERLSRGILLPILQYTSHLLLSDLVATGKQPSHLFHRIQSILSRPMTGHYAGFLRETARYYQTEGLTSSMPDLIEFLLRSEVNAELLPDSKALLGLLVDYRNLWAHGKMTNEEALEETVFEVRRLTVLLLNELHFLTKYELVVEGGISMMGSSPSKELPEKTQPLLVVTAGGVNLRPLLLKLKGRDLAILEDSDLRKLRMVYRGSEAHHQFKKKDLKRGQLSDVFVALKELIKKVRSIDALLPRADWESFSERSTVLTDQTLGVYRSMNKYRKEWYVPGREWEGDDGRFNGFLDSDKTLLTMCGVQGTGKSALVCHLAEQAKAAGHAVFLFNAQHFTFADVDWSGNPYPDFFSGLLHYERPFDRETIASLLKSRPKDKKVCIFIDALNEVDGIEKKWNRFRAMDLMLEWVSNIAKSGLKVILSFRLDAYEKFEYLRPEDWPSNLLEISFPGNHEEKPWVTVLEPFDEQRAEALYSRLQSEPRYGMAPAMSRYGMAPAMSWSAIQDGLSESLAEFTSNPLIFLIFLKIHHRETHLLTKDKDEMFSIYAQNLTGVSERKTQPWFKRVWDLICGGITPKEQFLSDIVSKMSEQGGSAFLIDTLNMKKKRDKRILSFLEDRRSFEELRDGGMVSEEPIEIELQGKSVNQRRISFVAELLLPVFESISRKIVIKKKLKGIPKILLGLSTFLATCWLAGALLAKPFSYVIEEFLIPKANFFDRRSLMIFKNSFNSYTQPVFSWAIVAMAGSLIALFFSEYLCRFFTILKFPSGKLGVFQSATQKFITSSNKKVILKLTVSWFIGFSVYTITKLILLGAVLSNIGSSKFATRHKESLGLFIDFTFHAPFELFFHSFVIWSIGLFLLAFVYAIFPGISGYYFLRLERPQISARIMKNSSRRFLSYIRSHEYRMWMLYSTLNAFVSPIVLICYAFYLKGTDFREILVTANNSSGLVGSIPVYGMSGLPNAVFNGMLAIATLSFFLSIFVPFLQRRGDVAMYNKIVKSPVIRPINRGYLKFSIVTFFIIGILFPIINYGFLYVYNNYAEEYVRRTGLTKNWSAAESAYKELKKKSGIIPFGIGNVGDHVLNLGQTDLNQGELALLKQASFYISALKLPRDFEGTLDLNAFDRLIYLAAPARSLRNLSKGNELRELVIYDPRNYFERTSGNDTVRLLHITGVCKSLGDLFNNFKSLEALRVSESVATKMPNMPTEYKNLVIEITDLQPELKWLTCPMAKNILALRSISKETRNLHMIQRLWLDIDGLQDPSTLSKLDSLVWLRFIARNEKPSKEFFLKLLDVLDQHLPKLQTLEFSTLSDSRLEIVFRSGFTKEQSRMLINQFLDDEIEMPWPKTEKLEYKMGKLWGEELFQ
jgi:hypothetical protein